MGKTRGLQLNLTKHHYMYFRILRFCELDKLPEVDEDYLLIQWKGHHFSVSIPAKQSKHYWFINKTSIVMRSWQTNCDKKCEDDYATTILNSWFMFDTFDIQCGSEISTTKYYSNACNRPKTMCMACVWSKTHRDAFEQTYTRIYMTIIFYASAFTHIYVHVQQNH